MRIVSKLLGAATAAAAITALAATPALADPPAGVTPKPADVVGVGSDTIQNVMDQFSVDYNKTHATGKLYSFDALNPTTGAMGDPIQLKSGSSNCNIPRPDGSSAGITALGATLTTTGGAPCIDFARSSRGPNTSTGPFTFINLAGDAVTVAVQPGSHAPKNLSEAQLTAIYNCTVTNWNQVGGTTGPIEAFAPQSGSGTRSFFLSALHLTAFGGCVSTSATRSGAAGANDNTLQENQGVAPILNQNKADVISVFSVGKWIAERFHSASCGTVSQCFADPTHCHPTATQNKFGCNTSGTMVLESIAGTKPTTGTGTGTVINKTFDPNFQRLLYEVVNQPAQDGTIPAKYKPYFGPTGFTCNSITSTKDLRNYGFLVLPKGGGPGQCGFSQPGT